MQLKGLYYPEVPAFTSADYDILLKKTKDRHGPMPEKDAFEEDNDDVIEKAVLATKGQKFLLNGVIVEI